MRNIAKVVLLIVSLSTLGFVLSGCSSGGAPVGNEVAATVNGRNIMLSEVEHLINQQMGG